MIKMKDKIFYHASIATLALAIGLTIYFSYLLYFPFKTVYLYPDNYQTVKKQYRAGELLTYRLHFIKYNNLSATVIRNFQNDMLFTLPTIQTCHPMGENNLISGMTTIPGYLPPGKYTYQSTVIFKINPLRDIVIEMKTNEFTVVEDDTKKNIK